MCFEKYDTLLFISFFLLYLRFTVYSTRFKILKAVETHGANTKGPRGD